MEFGRKYMDKLYGGFLGKVIGVIHGADIEGWSYQRIKNTFGGIDEYPYTFKNFCSDDDINGPLFYMRALKDFGYNAEITVKELAHTMANYVSDGHGFFWWGGYGISTEHTAYQNIMDGVQAPKSGSAKLNGTTVAEQIGGQIFSDCWGFVCPDDIKLAAALAGKMSSISHDGNGIYGGQFIAACIAKAFTACSIDEIVDAALEVIPVECEYSSMVRDIRKVCMQNNADWEKSFQYIEAKYGYQHYEGACHIIPNAAVIVLALIHGNGDFSRTINIGNMCGWDTDCNVGNLGSILGVYNGASGIENKWLAQVNDFICASSAIGYLNIQTVSQAAAFAAGITHHIYGIEPNEVFKRIFSFPEGQYFHFEFPTATHAMRTYIDGKKKVLLSNTEEEAFCGKHSLRITVPSLGNGDSFRLYYKSYYLPEDFDDSRYNPDFSPTIYTGDRISAYFKISDKSEAKVKLVPYFKDRISAMVYELIEEENEIYLDMVGWNLMSYRIPPMENIIVEEIGFKVICVKREVRETTFPLIIYMDELIITHAADVKMSFEKLPVEKWNAIHEMPAHLTYLRGIVRLQDGKLNVSGSGKDSEAYTGNMNWENYRFTTTLLAREGSEHSVLFRVQGAMRQYVLSFKDNNFVILYKKYGEKKELAVKSYPWKHGEEYDIEITVNGNKISVFINKSAVIFLEDNDKPLLYGCIGFGNSLASRTSYIGYELKELCAD